MGSYFIPTCSECSSTLPAPGIVSVRGESSMTLCRECHRKMSMASYLVEPQLADPAQAFKIPDIKFLLISTSAKANAAPPRKRVNTLYLSTISNCTSPLTNDVSPISLKKSSVSLQAKNSQGGADARIMVNPIAGSASVAARKSLLATNVTTKQPTTRTSTLTA